MRHLTVLSAGPLSTVQDLGRPGLAHLGIGRSGAVDRPALMYANEILGNDESCACLETTLGGLRIRFEDRMTIAVTGAPGRVTVDGKMLPMDGGIKVRPGQELRLGAPTVGLRNYLAVAGGLEVPPVLVSRSTDLLSGIGPARITAGDVLAVGDATGSQPAMTITTSWMCRYTTDPTLSVIMGPRDDWFTPAAVDALLTTEWTVTPQADRVGVRLSGPALERRITTELPSEPMVDGAIQVPPDGQPILFLADHPVTGGYPVIAVVTGRDLPFAGQLRPGRTVRFTRQD